MHRLSFIFIWFIALPSYAQSFHVRASDESSPVCLSVIPLLPANPFAEFVSRYRTEFRVMHTDSSACVIHRATCSASDHMPSWSGDTLSLVFNYSAFAGANAPPVTRTVKIETADCTVFLDVVYDIHQLRPVGLTTERMRYTSMDTLVITANGYFRTDGGCSPRIHWGLQRKADGEDWVEVVPLSGKSVMCCGPGAWQFTDYRDAIIPFNAPYYSHLLDQMTDSEYRVYAFENHFQCEVYSSAFYFERKREGESISAQSLQPTEPQNSPSAGSVFTDPRDGQHYSTIVIGGVRWFSQNLNYHSPQSVCFEDDSIPCGAWGRLYNYQEMKTVCPSGWRIPNRSDWLVLKAEIDKSSVHALMSPHRWKNNSQATNSTGLSLVPSGFKHKKKFHLQYINSSVWFHEPGIPGSNWHLHVDGNNNQYPYFFHDHEDEVFVRWFAVRCVCDAEAP